MREKELEVVPVLEINPRFGPIQTYQTNLDSPVRHSRPPPPPRPSPSPRKPTRYGPQRLWAMLLCRRWLALAAAHCRTHACTRSPTHPPTFAHAHAYTYTLHAYTHEKTQTSNHAYTQYPPARTCPKATRAHARTHARTRTRARLHTQTYTGHGSCSGAARPRNDSTRRLRW